MINFAENLTKMITAGLGGETEAPRTEVAVGHRLQYLDASGPVASFETNIVAPLRKLLVNMELIQAGSGDPSPENIRPISGREAVTVPRTGACIWGGEKMATDIAALGFAVDTTAKTVTLRPGVASVDGESLIDGVRFKENTQYTIICASEQSAINMMFVYTDGTNDRDLGRIIRRGASVSASGKTIAFLAYRSYSGSSVIRYEESGLFEGNLTAADFAPYDDQSVTVQLGQTIYGGTLDIAAGKLILDKAKATFDGDLPVSQFVFTASETRNRIAWSPYQTLGRVGSMYFISDTLTAENTYTNFPGIWKVATSSPNAARMFIGVPLTITSRDDWKTYITEHPINIVYALSEPVEIDLTPQQITTLIGDNNVWSDAGDVEVTYTYYEETEGY